MQYLIISLAILFAVAVVLVLLKKRTPAESGILVLQQRIDNLNSQLLQQLNTITQQVNERLKENVESIQMANRTVGDRLDNAARVVKQVDTRLSSLEETNKRIYEVGKDIASLQEILRAPKPRGLLGELLLGDLLAQILPEEHFTLQYQFRDGLVVDAVIHLRDNKLVPVDSKFPLENFRRMTEEKDEEEKRKYEKLFLTDVKKHIAKISESYIRPDENTLEFALMYIPAENVYYEIIKSREGHELIHFAWSKHVIPVSPNSFYMYLQAILLGLRGLRVEEHAKEIMQNLARLRVDFTKFADDFRVLGSHLSSARNKYDDSLKRLERLDDKLALASKEKEAREPLLPPA